MRGLNEVVAFKRLADGYVFRAPSRWLFGRAEHYRVDAARKDGIAVAIAETRIRHASMVYVILAAAFAGLASAITFRNHLPAVAACQLVPQAAMWMLRALRKVSSGIFISARKTRPVSSEMRPMVVSRMARGCSKISLSMKCL